ncbi:lytic transglycosylase domain-containing protein [Citrobacter freundii]|nr:lytic transglycosylase domain-containing protein [Citrobacter freundii]
MHINKLIFIILWCNYSISLNVWAKSYCYVDPHGIKIISTIKISKQHTVCSSSSTLPITLQQKLKVKLYSKVANKPRNTHSASNESIYHSEIMYFIQKISYRYNVDPNLVKAIIAVESGYNPDAVSPHGALGLMQLMPATAKELAENTILDVRERYLFDPQINVILGVKYLSELNARYNNNIELVLAAYHSGIGNVARYNNKIPPIAATQRYVRDVICLYKAKEILHNKSIFCKL